MGHKSNQPTETIYQRRNLNKCFHHGCGSKDLRAEWMSDGRLGFVCPMHGWLLDEIRKDVEEIKKKVGG